MHLDELRPAGCSCNSHGHHTYVSGKWKEGWLLPSTDFFPHLRFLQLFVVVQIPQDQDKNHQGMRFQTFLQMEARSDVRGMERLGMTQNFSGCWCPYRSDMALEHASLGGLRALEWPHAGQWKIYASRSKTSHVAVHGKGSIFRQVGQKLVLLTESVQVFGVITSFLRLPSPPLHCK